MYMCSKYTQEIKMDKEFNEAEEIRALDASNAYRVGFQATNLWSTTLRWKTTVSVSINKEYLYLR